MQALPLFFIMGFLLSAGQVLGAFAAHAQDVPAAAAPAGPVVADTQALKPEELEQMVAPIALYPDQLLAQVLMASTYPLEVVQADRWAQQNKSMKGDDLKNGLSQQSWDDSVKALASTPDVLSTMSTNLDWTQKLGDAVLAQQDGVMDAIQRLRSKAYDNKSLTSNEQQTIALQEEAGDQNIIIQSAAPDTVYVPYYNPTAVYGDWDYPDYPPVYYPPPPAYGVGAGFVAGIVFAGAAGVFDDWWDDDFDWGDNDIDVDINDSFNRTDVDRRTQRPGQEGGGQKWKHNPDHRHGVKYANNDVAKKFKPQQDRRQARPSQGGTGEYRGRELSSRNIQQDLAQRAPAQTPRNLQGGGTGQRAQRPPQRPATSDMSRSLSNLAPSSGHQFQDRTQSRNYQGTQRQSAFSPQQSARQTRQSSGRGHASLSGGSRGGSGMSSGGRSGGGRAGGGGGRGRR